MKSFGVLLDAKLSPKERHRLMMTAESLKENVKECNGKFAVFSENFYTVREKKLILSINFYHFQVDLKEMSCKLGTTLCKEQKANYSICVHILAAALSSDSIVSTLLKVIFCNFSPSFTTWKLFQAETSLSTVSLAKRMIDSNPPNPGKRNSRRTGAPSSRHLRAIENDTVIVPSFLSQSSQVSTENEDDENSEDELINYNAQVKIHRLFFFWNWNLFLFLGSKSTRPANCFSIRISEILDFRCTTGWFFFPTGLKEHRHYVKWFPFSLFPFFSRPLFISWKGK